MTAFRFGNFKVGLRTGYQELEAIRKGFTFGAVHMCSFQIVLQISSQDYGKSTKLRNSIHHEHMVFNRDYHLARILLSGDDRP